MGEGVVALNLARRANGPSATVSKVVIGSLGEDPFSDDTRLAKADRELNTLYRDLLKRLAPADQEALQMRSAWIEQREKQAADVKPDYYENNRIARDQALQRTTEERRQLKAGRSWCGQTLRSDRRESIFAARFAFLRHMFLPTDASR